MAFNANKIEVILLTLKHDIRNPKLIFDDTVVQFVESNKHLGVTLERNGQWHEHIESVIKSAWNKWKISFFRCPNT